jgi:hypothetical protein
MIGRKRLNPKTGKEFTRNDVREDGRIFRAYTKRVRKDGTYGESWVLPRVIEKDRRAQKQRQLKKRKNALRDPEIPRRLNSETNKEFKIGDQDKEGRYFLGYRNYSFNGVYVHEEWASEERWHKHHITQAYAAAKKRAAKKGVPFDISLNYVMDIFPKNFICPARGVVMAWSTVSGRAASPSLDRIKPHLGYVENNIIWISFRANIIKNDASADEILAVGEFFKSLEQ